MDALIECDPTSQTRSPVNLKNKWRSYRNGRHTPNLALVKAVETKFPGSFAVLNHPLWSLLRLGRSVEVEVPSPLSRLPPSLFTVVWGGSVQSHHGLVLAPEWNAQRLRKIERQAGLDALACLVALLRNAIESGDRREAHIFSRSLCRMMLMMGRWLYAHGIAQPMVDYLEELLLPLAAHDGQRHSFGEQGFRSAANRLIGTASMFEANENLLLTNVQKADLMLDFLDDKFTCELSVLVGSVTCPGA
ncbi:hypothetical protein E5678_13545 [Hydrogenophaga sp. PAMC20947]|nr:hypothetical protein E5678_13545 [Hydrogenophaga sp. PAMC20947]